MREKDIKKQSIGLVTLLLFCIYVIYNPKIIYLYEDGLNIVCATIIKSSAFIVACYTFIKLLELPSDSSKSDS